MKLTVRSLSHDRAIAGIARPLLRIDRKALLLAQDIAANESDDSKIGKFTNVAGMV